MTLRRKTFLIQATFFLLLLLLLDLTFTGVLRKSSEDLDRQGAEQNLARAEVSLGGEAHALYVISELWSNSDSTWQFMRGGNQNFPSADLDKNIITALGVSSMIFFDNEYNVRLFKDYSAADDPSAPENEFQAIITDNPENLARLTEIPISGIKGFANDGGKPILFSIQPIFNSKMEGERAGYLLMTRTVGPNLLHHLSQNLGFDFSVVPVTEEEKTRADELPGQILSDSGGRTGAIIGQRLLRDLGGAPAFWVTGVFEKKNNSAFERKIQLIFLLLTGVGLAFCGLYQKFSRHLIWDRISLIQKQLQETRDDSLARLNLADSASEDELSSLVRTINDSIAYINFSKERKENLDNITIDVYEKFSRAGSRLCYKTLEDIATAFTPRDENFRGSIIRMARKTERFARAMGVGEEERLYTYLGALFSRIGLLGVPGAARKRKWELSAQELREYQKYPLFSRDFLESVELLRPAATVPYAWKEHWDGSGFPRGLSGSAIPAEARLFAVVNEWNELTRPWPGRKMPSPEETEAKLRERAGTRLDPNLVEEFIKFLREEETGGSNDANS